MTSDSLNKALYLRTKVDSNLQRVSKNILSKPIFSTKGEILSPTRCARVYPVTKKLTSREYLKNAPTSGQLALFTRNWSKLTRSSIILDILKIYEITFLDLELFQVSTPPSVAMVQEEALLVDWEIQMLLRKSWIKLSSSSQNHYISPVFLPSIYKNDAGYFAVLTLKRLNQCIPYVC